MKRKPLFITGLMSRVLKKAKRDGARCPGALAHMRTSRPGVPWHEPVTEYIAGYTYSWPGS